MINIFIFNINVVILNIKKFEIYIIEKLLMLILV